MIEVQLRGGSMVIDPHGMTTVRTRHQCHRMSTRYLGDVLVGRAMAEAAHDRVVHAPAMWELARDARREVTYE